MGEWPRASIWGGGCCPAACLPQTHLLVSNTPLPATPPPCFPCPSCLQRPQPSEEQVAAAEALVAAMDLPDFDPWTIANPALQRHYQASSGCACGSCLSGFGFGRQWSVASLVVQRHFQAR